MSRNRMRLRERSAVPRISWGRGETVQTLTDSEASAVVLLEDDGILNNGHYSSDEMGGLIGMTAPQRAFLVTPGFLTPRKIIGR